MNDTFIIQIDEEVCTGCGRCAEVCPVNAIEGAQGTPHVVNEAKCVLCGQCVQTCSAFASVFEARPTSDARKKQQRNLFAENAEPLFAAWHTGDAPEVAAKLAQGVFSMVQCAPAVRVAIGEEFGMDAGALTPGKLAAALRRAGFSRVYDTNFAADLTIMEEGSELLKRIAEGGTLPMFTSCCPAWVRYAELNYPDLLGHLSSCKSPQQMAGAVFKSYGAQLDGRNPEDVYSVAVMPCTCKKYEADRPEMQNDGVRNVDAVLTTRELAAIIRHCGIDFASLPEEEFDTPLGTYSGAGNIFGLTGGVMEAALRTAYELVTGKAVPQTELAYVRGGEGLRKAELTMNGRTYRVAVVAGLQYVAPLFEDIRKGINEFDFIEVMCCPQGCISGGGQPKVLLPYQRQSVYEARKASLYHHDSALQCRKSHENKQVRKLYTEYLGEPLGHLSHTLLHTRYGTKH
ncbi:[FeFe] hydrogenase, group A [Oleidesulfovibrio sp.]|uniref:[FeFe] hydrogenase, group A n=1 Tax=Oleidesulfovibrio sp. TaxID=2909707 RepID=UPI003A8691BE